MKIPDNRLIAEHLLKGIKYCDMENMIDYRLQIQCKPCGK